MLTRPTALTAAALTALTLLASAPTPGRACSDASVPGPEEIEVRIAWPEQGASLPIDARLDVRIHGPDDDSYIDRLRAQITADGAPVAGSFERVPNTSRSFWWSPDAPWPADAAVEFTVWLDAPGVADPSRLFTTTDQPGPAPQPLADVVPTVCLADVVTERAPCDDLCGCGADTVLATELRGLIRFTVPDQVDASRLGYRLTYAFGATPEQALAAAQGELFPGQTFIQRGFGVVEPGDQRCVTLRRFDRADAIVDSHTACAEPVARCDGEPLDADDPPAEGGCSQGVPDGSSSPLWWLGLLLIPVVGRRLRSR